MDSEDSSAKCAMSMRRPAPAERKYNKAKALAFCTLQHFTVPLLNDWLATRTIPALELTTPDHARDESPHICMRIRVQAADSPATPTQSVLKIVLTL